MYKVFLSRRAERFLGSLSGKDYKLVESTVSSLAVDPYQPGCKKLKGQSDTFRVRSGNYRILYTVQDEILTVEIVDIGNRRDIYD
jgi:mRNA interferase RelE/StbE